WTQLVPTGAPPLPAQPLAIALDAVASRLLAVGNAMDSVAVCPLTGTPSWTMVPASGGGPGVRQFPSGVFDPVRRQLLMFAGNSVWPLSASTGFQWQPVSATGTPPPSRWAAHMVFDELRDRALVFGGGNSTPGDSVVHYEHFDDTWALPRGPAPAWEQLSLNSTRPTAVVHHTLTLDRSRSRLIWIGGLGLPNNKDMSSVGVWSVEHGGRWERIATQGPVPPPRYAHTATYDAAHDRILVVGGQGDSGGLSDVWELALADMRWSPIVTTGAPGALI